MYIIKRSRSSLTCVLISSFFLQPLVFTTFSLAKAEEMADLIDGYCMLFSGKKHSLVFKKLGRAKRLDSTAFIIQDRKKIEIHLPSGPVNFSFNLPWLLDFKSSPLTTWPFGHAASFHLNINCQQGYQYGDLRTKCEYIMLGFYLNPCFQLIVSILSFEIVSNSKLLYKASWHFYLDSLSRLLTEANLTCPLDHQTSILTCPRGNFLWEIRPVSFPVLHSWPHACSLTLCLRLCYFNPGLMKLEESFVTDMYTNFNLGNHCFADVERSLPSIPIPPSPQTEFKNK